MSRIEPSIVPDEFYSARDVDRLFDALERRLRAREILHAKEAAEFLGISLSQLYRKKFGIPFHIVPGIGKVFLRSELVEHVKRH